MGPGKLEWRMIEVVTAEVTGEGFHGKADLNDRFEPLSVGRFLRYESSGGSCKYLLYRRVTDLT
jgi:hypothetical protein